MAAAVLCTRTGRPAGTPPVAERSEAAGDGIQRGNGIALAGFVSAPSAAVKEENILHVLSTTSSC